MSLTVDRVAVLGASGKTGRAVTASLAARGVETVGLGRADAEHLAERMTGCGAAYVLAPNLHPDEPAYVEAALAAARTAGVGRVVYHSVVAPYAPAMPHHLGKAISEDLVRRSGLAWTILQPGAYVQNFLADLRRADPGLRVPYDVDALFGLVDLAEVGEAAATVLLEEGHAGATYELGGPRLVSVRDVAAAAERVLGRAVPAERIDPATWTGEGLEQREREWLGAMFAYYDRHGLPAGGLPLAALLNRPACGVEETLRRELG